MTDKYIKQAKSFLKTTNSSLIITYFKNGYHFADDEENRTRRNIFNVSFYRGIEGFHFHFGDSVHNSGKGGHIPNEYDILSCLTTYCPDNFNDFCDEYGYDYESKADEKIYEKALDEADNLQKMFNSSELELLSEIQ